MISVTVAGNLAADCRQNTAGTNEVTNFVVLSNTMKGGEDVTTQCDCALWGKRGTSLAPYLKKGTFVVVSGSGHTELYEGKKGPGVKLAVNVNDVKLGPKPRHEDDYI
jgi:single-strand DNA-binding protein